MKLFRSAFVLTMLFVALVPATPSVAQETEDAWAFDGGGWGHGVGLSQFGAYGMARYDDRSVAQILSHFYDGTSVAPFPSSSWVFGDKALHVGLEQDLTSVSLGAVGNPIQVCQPVDTCAVSFSMAPGEDWKFENTPSDPTKCRFRHVNVTNTGPGPCSAQVTWTDDGGSTRLKVGSKEYAHGTLKLIDSGSSFHVVLATGLENYLYGLAEMPSSWGIHGMEALKAQAIIGRGYVVATAIARGGSESGNGRLGSCACHIRDDSRDQVFNGWSKENETSNGVTWGKTYWQPAVNSTAGLVVTHPQSTAAGDIISAYYSSSTGGHTEDNEDVWGGSARPWLRSRSDPWGANGSHNPLARWTVYVTPSDLATSLGWSEVTTATVLTGPPGTVVRFKGKSGTSDVQKDLTGYEVRAILGSKGFRSDGAAVRTSPYLIAVTPPYHFQDIGTSTHRDDIVYIWEHGITKGCNPPDNTLYCPTQSVTRGQMAAFLVRALDLPSTNQDFFTDDNGSTFENDINRLAAAGITKGCSATRFCPEDAVTRGQMAAFLHRALDGQIALGSAVSFVDDNGHTFENDIEWLGATGITKGCNPPTNDRYCPNDRVSRAQMASFLARSIQLAE